MQTETIAAVLSGKGVGAIGVIGVYGKKTEQIVKQIFQPKNKIKTRYEKGDMILGSIMEGGEIIDEVLIACEENGGLFINCHGNQLIEADILRLLQKNKAKAVSAEKFLSTTNKSNSIELEMQLAIAKAKTLKGTKLLVAQKLSETLCDWQQNPSLEDIKAQAQRILQISKPVNYLIYGAKIVLAGAPNSGKSTLLNYLAGKQKAIVTDIKGTTRDWVSAECQLGKLCCEIIDTAGIDKILLEKSGYVDKEAQSKAHEFIKKTDLILWLIDGTKKIESEPKDKSCILVINKSDLIEGKNNIGNRTLISAKNGDGIKELINQINQTLKVNEINFAEPFCFTERQERLLEQILETNSKEVAISAISELLNGKVCV